jgi:hypothetical protein
MTPKYPDEDLNILYIEDVISDGWEYGDFDDSDYEDDGHDSCDWDDCVDWEDRDDV